MTYISCIFLCLECLDRPRYTCSMNEEQPMENISRTAVREFWKQLRRHLPWIIPILIVYYGIAFNLPIYVPHLIFLPPILIPIAWYGKIWEKVHSTFWKQVAKKYGWRLVDSKDLTKENALLFKQGHSGRTGVCLIGHSEGRFFEIFQYFYTVGHGKHATTYEFMVFEFKVKGTFPHLYVNNKKDSLHFSGRMFMPKISLTPEFEKQFELFAPKEYEIEALEIFTPDTMQHLLDTGWRHDLELVDSEILIYRYHHFNGAKELEDEYTRIQKFVDYLMPKLNRLKLEKIGDMPHMLK